MKTKFRPGITLIITPHKNYPKDIFYGITTVQKWLFRDIKKYTEYSIDNIFDHKGITLIQIPNADDFEWFLTDEFLHDQLNKKYKTNPDKMIFIMIKHKINKEFEINCKSVDKSSPFIDIFRYVFGNITTPPYKRINVPNNRYWYSKEYHNHRSQRKCVDTPIRECFVYEKYIVMYNNWKGKHNFEIVEAISLADVIPILNKSGNNVAGILSIEKLSSKKPIREDIDFRKIQNESVDRRWYW